MNRRKRICGSVSKLFALALWRKSSFSTATENAQGKSLAHDALFMGAVALLKAGLRPSVVFSSSPSSPPEEQDE